MRGRALTPINHPKATENSGEKSDTSEKEDG